MHVVHMQGFDDALQEIRKDFHRYAHAVDTGHWQAMKDVPMTKTFELLNVTFETAINITPERWHNNIKPSDPWAELQFKERVAGRPVNPGDTFHLWPWYRGNVEQHKEQGEFSHTYMERFWPRWAGDAEIGSGHTGIRYRYGDLNDVLNLLAREPFTRQAYLPIFFPEDTGAHHKERIPCTLGYHFILRPNIARNTNDLHVVYNIRSCDFYRHFIDDVYMAGRLAHHIIEQLVPRHGEDDRPNRDSDSPWANATPGKLTMHITSLHIFEGDKPRLKRELRA